MRTGGGPLTCPRSDSGLRRDAYDQIQHVNDVNEDDVEVTVGPYDEWNRELIVAASASGFAGRSSAYISADELRRFAHRITQYPLRNEPIVISPGYVDEEHVRLGVGSVDRLGHIGLAVHLATPRIPGDRPEAQHEVRLELMTSYERLRRFASELTACVDDPSAVAPIETELG